MAGRLYVSGGLKETKNSLDLAIADVYEFDLAGPRHWKHCASMQHAREAFGCGVIGGKIYVFGGTAGRNPVFGCEVYDPKEDAWSPIAALAPWRFNQKVTALGEELFVHSGRTCRSEFIEWARDRVLDPYDSSDSLLFEWARGGGFDIYDDSHNLRESRYTQETYSADVYHPLKDAWREMENFIDTHRVLHIVFMVNGKLHKMEDDEIQVFDTIANSWKLSQRISCRLIKSTESFHVGPLAVVVCDEELLAMVHLSSSLPLPRRSRTERKICLMKSEGLGAEHKEIVWRKAQCSRGFENLISHFMCPVQL